MIVQRMDLRDSFDKVLRWRYLDSLDSIRFSKEDLTIKPIDLQDVLDEACYSVMATILLGNGIIFPVNQLIDSFGLLRILSEVIKIIESNEKKGRSVYFPFKFSFYNYQHEEEGGDHLQNPFLLAAYLFKKDGANGRTFFELSAWPNLDPERRQKLANYLIEQKPLPPPHFCHEEDHEEKLFEDLFRIIGFFNQRRTYIEKARPNKDIRTEMLQNIAKLSINQITTDSFLQKALCIETQEIFDQRLSLVTQAASIFKLIDTDGFIDNRSKIRRAFRENSGRYFSGDGKQRLDQRIGMNAIVDSIYNYASFIGTRAKQVRHSLFMEKDVVWKYDELAYTLGNWARNQYLAHNPITNPLAAPTDANIDYHPSQSNWIDATHDHFWEQFFDSFQDQSWLSAIKDYSQSLSEYEIAHRSFFDAPIDVNKKKILLEQAKIYRDKRITLISLINYKFSNSHFKVVIDEEKNVTHLVNFDQNGRVQSKIQIEDFSKDPILSAETIIGIHSNEIASDISTKGDTTNYESWFI